MFEFTEYFASCVDADINPSIIVTLLIIGAAIKHYAPKVSNNLIPAIIFIFSAIMCTGFNPEINDGLGITPHLLSEIIISAVLHASIAIGIHNGGKVSLKALTSSSNNKEASDEILSDILSNKTSDAEEESNDAEEKSDDAEEMLTEEDGDI